MEIGFGIEPGFQGGPLGLGCISCKGELAESLKDEHNPSMKLCMLFLLTIALSVGFTSVQAQKITKELVKSDGKDRAYYLFVPDKLSKSAQVPLIVMLHGSGRNGLPLVEKWKDLAKKEGIIIAGPDSGNSETWAIPADAPDFLRDLVESLKSKYPINPRRVYLFGHSAGAVAGLFVSLLESQYFAAAVVHAGALRANDTIFIEQAKRKIPISIFVGTVDPLFPLADVRATRDALNSRGFESVLVEIKGHNHWYYNRSDEINRGAWDFLKRFELGAEPIYEEHNWAKE